MAPKKVLMAASGDLRQSANETCWPAQAAMEKQVAAALAAFGVEVERAHPYDPARKHGFIASQKEGLEIFAKVDPDTPIIVAEAVWQYSYHVLPGLLSHRAPILTIANWSGEWPGAAFAKSAARFTTCTRSRRRSTAAAITTAAN